MTNDEEKLYKLMVKAEKKISKFYRDMTEIDEKVRDLSIRTSLIYNVESRYFDKMAPIVVQLAKLETNVAAIARMIDLQKEHENES